MRFSANSYTTDWINLEIGMVMGCTIYPILLIMAMEVILKAAEGSAGPANLAKPLPVVLIPELAILDVHSGVKVHSGGLDYCMSTVSKQKRNGHC
ncbi:hypothetical protein RRG08_047462 [Elysia crispata]|uniref:Uncharacterized protein n=1 Tax=Elysia crispata TaxID=231223 RepID=A0AAE0YVI3_9GAST|nr:hypothetical protein RRG08_047462 [Elysia crispata]